MEGMRGCLLSPWAPGLSPAWLFSSGDLGGVTFSQTFKSPQDLLQMPLAQVPGGVATGGQALGIGQGWGAVTPDSTHQGISSLANTLVLLSWMRWPQDLKTQPG